MDRHGVFYAQVFCDDGPTGELVVCDRVILEDHGGNVLAGPFDSTEEAMRRKERFRVPCRFRPVPGTIHRRDEHNPEYLSVDCGVVVENDITKAD